VLDEGLPKGVCLNVNFPVVDHFEGVKICRMAPGTWGSETVKCHHPRGYDYWWMVGKYTNDEPEAEDTDNWALTHGYVAITPTKIDVTSYEMIEQMKNWDL
jgi:5'-nucleotidase